jgi:hypothetical protein
VANLDEVPTTGPTAVPPIVPMAASLIARLATSFGSVSLPAILSEAISVLAATKPSVTAPVVASLTVSLAIAPTKLLLVSSAVFAEAFTGSYILLNILPTKAVSIKPLAKPAKIDFSAASSSEAPFSIADL